MEKNADFYNLSQTLAGAIYGAGAAVQRQTGERPSPAPPLLQLRSGYAESPGWFLVQALEFDPEPLTVEKLRVRDIYASEQLVAAFLELMRSEGWLVKQSSGHELTESGRSLITSRIQASNERLRHVDLGEWAPNLNRLESLLARINDASLKAPDPPGAWCLRHSRQRAYLSEGHPLARIRQYTSDWNAFRDDAHMAAFKMVEPRAYLWEAFTLIGQPEMNSSEEINRRLFYRGHSAEIYENGLLDLVRHLWLNQVGNKFSLTAHGEEIRQKVENLTDQFFFAPWSILSENEGDELAALMAGLKSKLEEFAAEEP
ncbi:MAG: hypothetical protein QNJ45_02245 [Ardenticatenaceae bacterium]|nr:hypothetical protein [Ardenticatenaceae bacterium]